MIGAAIGDIIGSRFEGNPIKSKDFSLFDAQCRFTDDTVCTVAVIDILLNRVDPAESFRHWGQKYPFCGYGSGFMRWLSDTRLGPYGSFGNGAAMRVSPAGFLARTEKEVYSYSDHVTQVTHNHPHAINAARATALSIFLARLKYDIPTIRNRIVQEFHYDLSQSVDSIRPHYRFDSTAQGTVPQALTCAFEAQNFEEAIRNAISLGGDSDTLGAISGSVAEALYGIPQPILHTATSFLDTTLNTMFQKLYAISSPTSSEDSITSR